MNKAYRISIICGATPLVAGVSIFLLWLITRWEWLMDAGLITILIGLVMFVVGGIALGRFWWITSRSDFSQARLQVRLLISAAILLANFPVACGIVQQAIAISENERTRYIVVIHNVSRQSLNRVRVYGGGCDTDFGTIPPGESSQRHFWIQHEDELKFEAIGGSTTYSHTIDGYVTNGMGGHKKVTVNSDGSISVIDTVR